MAFEAVKLRDGVMGDVAYQVYTWSAGSDATGVIVTGFSGILMAIPNNGENVSEGSKVEENVGAGGAENGSVKITPADTTNGVGRILILGTR